MKMPGDLQREVRVGSLEPVGSGLYNHNRSIKSTIDSINPIWIDRALIDSINPNGLIER